MAKRAVLTAGDALLSRAWVCRIGSRRLFAGESKRTLEGARVAAMVIFILACAPVYPGIVSRTVWIAKDSTMSAFVYGMLDMGGITADRERMHDSLRSKATVSSAHAMRRWTGSASGGPNIHGR